MIWFDKVLPKARAFILSKNKQITEFFTALENVYLDAKKFVEDVYLDIWPASTRQLDLWDEQFNLRNDSALTISQRRARLDAAWKRHGGQSPYYIQTTMQAAGFNVWIHEWWEPGFLLPVPRNPNDFLGVPFVAPVCGEALALCDEPSAQCTDPSMGVGSFSYIVEAGEAEAEAGNAEAESGNFIPGSDSQGYLLVNKISETVPSGSGTQCGEPLSQCGEPTALSGVPSGLVHFIVRQRVYPTPTDVNEWPYILYFCGPVFGEPATIQNNRRDEFENLLLSICPAQQWLALLITYV